jgi:hypothetical protein
VIAPSRPKEGPPVKRAAEEGSLMRYLSAIVALLVDLRQMPRDLQEIAFAKGLIPYIPADRKDRS